MPRFLVFWKKEEGRRKKEEGRRKKEEERKCLVIWERRKNLVLYEFYRGFQIDRLQWSKDSFTAYCLFPTS
ncbi:MAG: hypothetical protein F6K15_07295 [Okeania sp. SIO2B3]|nr:hypothetical protein [Okeania sp. SIO2B3]